MKSLKELTQILLELIEGRFFLSQDDLNFLSKATSKEVALAQQNLLLVYGLSVQTLWQLWNNHSEILPDVRNKLKHKLPDDHIIRRIIAEHDMILCFIADLYNVNFDIQLMSVASSNSIEIRKLANITEHLFSMEQHRLREDDLIFPELKKRGYENLSAIIDGQHGQISDCHHKLKQLIWMVDKIEFEEFKTVLAEIVKQLVPIMRKHIFVENNIILPLVLEFMGESNFWQKVKELNDQMGYCSFHP